MSKLNHAQREAIKRRYHSGEKSIDLGAEFGVTPAYVRQTAGARYMGQRQASTPAVEPPPLIGPTPAQLSRDLADKRAEALRLHAKRVPLTAIAAIVRLPYAALVDMLPLASPDRAPAIVRG